jgi:predicted HicB family RNase H-like nuclease
MKDTKILRIGLLPLFDDYKVYEGIKQCAKLRGQKRLHFIAEAIESNDKEFAKRKIDVADSEELHKYLKEQATKHKTTVIGYVERCCINHCHATMQEILPKKDQGYGF